MLFDLFSIGIIDDTSDLGYIDPVRIGNSCFDHGIVLTGLYRIEGEAESGVTLLRGGFRRLGRTC